MLALGISACRCFLREGHAHDFVKIRHSAWDPFAVCLLLVPFPIFPHLVFDFSCFDSENRYKLTYTSTNMVPITYILIQNKQYVRDNLSYLDRNYFVCDRLKMQYAEVKLFTSAVNRSQYANGIGTQTQVQAYLMMVMLCFRNVSLKVGSGYQWRYKH